MVNVDIFYLNRFHIYKYISYIYTVQLKPSSVSLCMYLLSLASCGGTERVAGVVVPLKATVQVLW